MIEVIIIFCIIFCWIISGIIPGKVVWGHNYNEELPLVLYLISAIGGPVAGIVHLANWRIK